MIHTKNDSYSFYRKKLIAKKIFTCDFPKLRLGKADHKKSR